MTGRETIIEAAKAGEVAKIREVLSGDPALIDTRADSGEGLIELALYRGKMDAVNALIESGRRLDIWEAAALGRLDRVEELAAREPALVDACSPGGYFPLALAAFFGHQAVAGYLLDNGADVHQVVRNYLGVTPLHAALAGRHVEIAEELVARGADVNVAQPQGFRPLHSAAFHGLEGMVKLLLARGADPAAKNDAGATALDLAIERGHENVAALLRARSEARV